MGKIGDDGLYIHWRTQNYKKYGLRIGQESSEKSISLAEALKKQQSLIQNQIFKNIKVAKIEDKKTKILELLKDLKSMNQISQNKNINMKESFFNEFFNDKISMDNFCEGITQIIQQNFGTNITINWENISAHFIDQTNQKGIQGEKAKSIKKGSITDKEIKNILNNIEKYLKKGDINPEDPEVKAIENIKNKLQEFINNKNNFSSYKNQHSSAYSLLTKIESKNEKEAAVTLGSLIEKYNQYIISAEAKEKLSNIQGFLGEIVFVAIAYLSSIQQEKISISSAEDAIQNIIKKGLFSFASNKKGEQKYKTAGSNLLPRIYTDVQWNTEAFRKFAKKIEDNLNKKEKRTYKIGNNGVATVNYTMNPDGTQGKIDVDFSVLINEKNNFLSDFKFSVKNYSSTSSISLVNGTSLLYYMSFFNPEFNAHWLNMYTFASNIKEDFSSLKEDMKNANREMKKSIFAVALTGYIGKGKVDKMANILAINKSSSSDLPEIITTYDILKAIEENQNLYKINGIEDFPFIRQQYSNKVSDRISNLLMSLHKIKLHINFYFSKYKKRT